MLPFSPKQKAAGGFQCRRYSFLGKWFFGRHFSQVFLALLFLACLQHCIGYSATAGSYFIQNPSDKGARLMNHVLHKLDASSVLDCVFSCQSEGCCVSINYMEPRQQEMNCELNDARGSEKRNDLFKDGNFRHYEMIGTVNEQSPGQCSSANPTKTCDEVLGSTKECPGKTCQEIKRRLNTSSSRAYWIKPDEASNSFQAYCDMETHGGGWTLVYRYTFTNYTDFYHSQNAVNPRPNWPAANATVKVSKTAPRTNGTAYGAVDFQYWKSIGYMEFMTSSNITSSYICQAINGCISHAKTGPINCTEFKTLTGPQEKNCTNGTGVPEQIVWTDNGPKLQSFDGNPLVSFDGSTKSAVPRHGPCRGKSHITDVAEPVGEMYLR